MIPAMSELSSYACMASLSLEPTGRQPLGGTIPGSKTIAVVGAMRKKGIAQALLNTSFQSR